MVKFRRQTSLPSVNLQLPNFVDKDFIPATLQSMWVATQEYPASPPSLASQSVCFELDAISSRDLGVSNSGSPCVSPVLVVDQEIAVIPVTPIRIRRMRVACPTLRVNQCPQYRSASLIMWWSLRRIIRPWLNLLNCRPYLQC